MKCENAERLDLGEVFTYFGNIMFCLHGSGLNTNSSLNRLENQNSLVRRDALNTAISHLNIFLLFK